MQVQHRLGECSREHCPAELSWGKWKWPSLYNLAVLHHGMWVSSGRLRPRLRWPRAVESDTEGADRWSPSLANGRWVLSDSLEELLGSQLGISH